MREQAFKGQVALVNAAAGSGIGSAVVLALLTRDASLMATAVGNAVVRVAC